MITYWGTEVRYDGNNRGRINQGGPGLSWKDTVLTDNTLAGRGIHPGEQLIHLQTAGKTEQEGGTSP